jgi:hypothetical protein
MDWNQPYWTGTRCGDEADGQNVLMHPQDIVAVDAERFDQSFTKDSADMALYGISNTINRNRSTM